MTSAAKPPVEFLLPLVDALSHRLKLPGDRRPDGLIGGTVPRGLQWASGLLGMCHARQGQNADQQYTRRGAAMVVQEFRHLPLKVAKVTPPSERIHGMAIGNFMHPR